MNEITSAAEVLAAMNTGWGKPIFYEEIIKPLNNEIKTLTGKDLSSLFGNCGTIAAWDFTTSLGDTIKEKYESLYVKFIEISKVVKAKTGTEVNIIITSPEISSIFETSTTSFDPGDHFDSEMTYVGTFNNKWKLWKTNNLPKHCALIGVLNNQEIIDEPTHLARLTIHNFFI